MNYETLYERYIQGRISKPMLMVYVRKGIITYEQYETIIHSVNNEKS